MTPTDGLKPYYLTEVEFRAMRLAESRVEELEAALDGIWAIADDPWQLEDPFTEIQSRVEQVLNDRHPDFVTSAPSAPLTEEDTGAD